MPSANNATKYWIIGIVIGLIVWLGVTGIGSLSMVAGLLLGVVAALLMAGILIWLNCYGHESVDAQVGEPAPVAARAATAPLAVMPKPEPAAPAAAAQPAKAAAASVATKPAEPVVKQAAPVTRDPEPVAKPAKPAVKKAAASKKEAPKKEASAAKKATPAAKATRPKAKKTAVKTDNLKEIKGVGPKLEELLHENGVKNFAQIAAWNEAEIDRFVELIGRTGGRIRSDDWVAQAKVLAAGGETEFSTRVDKGEVY